MHIDQDNGLEKQNSINFAVARKWDHQLTFPKDLNDHITKEQEKGLNVIIQHTEYALLNYLCGKYIIFLKKDHLSYLIDGN